jgi:deoxyribonuclease V
MISLQRELASKVLLKKLPTLPRLVAGFDLSFLSKEKALAVGVVLDFKTLEIVELKWTTAKVDIPYIPGLLSFREGPAILKVYSMLENDPDLLFFDGQGIAHPRHLGLAAHMALELRKPSIGVAKSHLYGKYELPEKKRGKYTYMYDAGKKIGVVLTTKDNVKPLFVSPGSYVDFSDCVEYTLKTSKGYKLPEPTRIADMYTKKLKKEVIDS